MSELVLKGTLDELLAHRARALEEYAKGMEHMLAAEAAAYRAVQESEHYCYFSLTDRHARHSAYAKDLDLVAFRKEVDRQLWRFLIESTAIRQVMGRSDIEAFEKLVEEDPPEATPETVYATLDRLRAGAGGMFAKSVVEVFEQLPRAYRTNLGNRIGEKLILEHAFEPRWPSLSCFEWAGRVLYDLEKALCLVGALPPPPPAGVVTPLLAAKIRENGKDARGWIAETPLLVAKAFKKGTIHVEFLRRDLVDALNKILAGHYGAVIAADNR
jgi:hypothetical protein